MNFSRMIHAGAVAMTMAAGPTSLPAYAQSTWHVVDSKGHELGILIPAHDIPVLPAVADTAMFDTIDGMMARDMAVLEAADRDLIIQLNDTLRAVPVTDQIRSKQGSAWQRFTISSISMPETSCTQIITMTSDGRATPHIEISNVGDRSCPTLRPSMTTGKHADQNTISRIVTPAVDTHSGSPTEKTAGSTL